MWSGETTIGPGGDLCVTVEEERERPSVILSISFGVCEGLIVVRVTKLIGPQSGGVVRVDGDEGETLVLKVFNEFQYSPHGSVRGRAVGPREVDYKNVRSGKVGKRVLFPVNSW